MTSISPLGAAFFFAAVAIVFLGIVISILEALAAWRFVPWVFRFGPRILKMQVALPHPQLPLAYGEPGTTTTGRFRMADIEECLFRPRQSLSWTVHTPFPIRGVIAWRGSQALVEGRLPLGGFIAYGAWVLGLTIWCILAWPDPQIAPLAPWILVGGWVFATLICWWSIWFELKRARRIVAELTRVFETAAA